MEPKDRVQMSAHEDERNLKAAVAARRELGPEYEDQVLEAFLGRVQASIDDRVSRQLARRGDLSATTAARSEATGDVSHSASDTSGRSGGSVAGIRPMKGEAVDLRVILGTFVLAIPLLAIASDVAQSLGVLLVMLALVSVNLLYFIDRWVRMG